MDTDFLMVFLREADRSYGFSQRARVSATGSFTLNDIFDGRYRLGIAGQGKDCYLKDVRYGAVDGLADGFNVSRAPLELTVTSKEAFVPRLTLNPSANPSTAPSRTSLNQQPFPCPANPRPSLP